VKIGELDMLLGGFCLVREPVVGDVAESWPYRRVIYKGGRVEEGFTLVGVCTGTGVVRVQGMAAVNLERGK